MKKAKTRQRAVEAKERVKSTPTKTTKAAALAAAEKKSQETPKAPEKKAAPAPKKAPVYVEGTRLDALQARIQFREDGDEKALRKAEADRARQQELHQAEIKKAQVTRAPRVI